MKTAYLYTSENASKDIIIYGRCGPQARTPNTMEMKRATGERTQSKARHIRAEVEGVVIQQCHIRVHFTFKILGVQCTPWLVSRSRPVWS
jgi:hypothetical protein